MFRRVISWVLGLLLALLPLVGMAEATFSMAGFDGEDSRHVWNTNGFFARMQEKTGISFTFAQYTKRSDWEAAKAAMFAEDGDLPDVLFKAALTTPEMIRLSEGGKLIDLKPLLPENAPNLWALLQQHPEWLHAITLPGGQIVALPTITETPAQNVLWINQTWLDKLKLDKPSDWDSLRTVLTAFRDRDPNQNGKKDEIPLAFLGPWELKFFSAAYGVAANDYNLYLDEAGRVNYWPLDERFLDMAQQLRGLFRDGLLDPNGFVTGDALRRINDDKNPVTFGAFFAPTPGSLVTFDMSRQYVVLDPFVYNGKQVWRDLVGPITRGTFAITSACEDPAALLRWVDTLYAPEGAIEAMVGYEGENYELTADGYWDWKGGLDNVTGAMLDDLSVYDTGDMPWLFPQAFYSRYTEENVRRVDAELQRFAQFVVKPMPEYALTLEEREKVLAWQAELGPYVDETLARIVLGELEVNDLTAQAFAEGLHTRGADELVQFWQSVVDRAEP